MAPEKSPNAGGRGRRTTAIVVAAVLLVVGAFAAGRVTGPQVGTPSTTSAEAGFARDMQVHHAQAVEMSMMIRDETSDKEIRLLAYDIALNQSQGAGQLYGLLDEWNLPQASPDPVMTWMSLPTLNGADGMAMGTTSTASPTMPAPGSAMPGLATAAQLKELGSLRGVPAEKLYLTLMIAHHKGGIEMADALLARSDYPSTTRFATGMVSIQQSEITYMESLLAAR